MRATALGALLAALLLSGCAAREARFDPLAAPWEELRPYMRGSAAEEPELRAELRRANIYHLNLAVADGLTQVTGFLRVRYVNRESSPQEAVPFFVYPNLTPGSLSITHASAGGEPVDPQYRRGPHLAWLPLPGPLSSGGSIELGLEYVITVPVGSDGAYGGFAFNEGVLSLAFACPLIPAFGAWDREPPVPYGDFLTAEASFFLARVSLPPGWELASPGAGESRRGPEGRAETVLALGPARDLYLAAVKDYVRRERREGSVTVVSWAPKGSEPGGELALETAAEALRSFSRRFGDYPYTRLALVAAPFEAYGSEFPGIVLLASRLFDLAGDEKGVPNRVLLEATVAHEVAHQWFFGTVGNDQVREPWLDEGPAQYATWLYYRDRYGEASAQGFFASFESRWERVRRADIPIGLPVGSYSPKEYGAIVYGRAPLFLDALSETIGEEGFDRLLADYCRRFRWRIASGGEFMALAEEAGRVGLAELAAEWGVNLHEEVSR